MYEREPQGMAFDVEKLWAVGWVVAAFISLASGGIWGALAFALLGIDSLKQNERDDEPALPVPPIPASLPIGNTTRMGVIPTEATEVHEPFDPQDLASIPAPQPPRPEPQTPVAVHVPVNVHNHMGGVSKPAPKTASPAQSDRRTSEPDLSLYPDPRERMQVLLKAMAESGFPLGKLLNHPFVWCWGRSQSGKTTIALLLAVARMAMGHKVSYFTTDDDYPRQLPWVRVEDSPEGYAIALDDVRDTISSAGKQALRGQSWVFDEMLAASAEHGIAIQPLLTCVLMKGAKTRGGVIGISQADKSTAHNLKGIDAAWRDERISVQAIHEEDELGDRYPTGRYLVDGGDDIEEWFIPEWMLTELNQWGTYDPVVWVCQRFPELLISSRNRPQKKSGSANNNPPVQDGSGTVQSGSGTVQGRFNGSELNRWFNELEPLNRLYGKAVQDSVQDGSRFMNQRFTAEEAKNEVDRLKDVGLNQTQIIEVLWGVKKGGSEAYKNAVAEYKFLTGES